MENRDILKTILKVSTIILIFIIIMILIFGSIFYIEFDESTIISGTYEYGELQTLTKGKAYLKGKFFLENGIFVSSSIEDNINRDKLGIYDVIYKAEFLSAKTEIRSKVQIVDTTPPKIELKTIQGNYFEPNENYIEEGYVATDNYDGDISSQVQIRQEGTKIFYTVSDSSGNTTTVTRDIQYKDTIKPELTLKGEQTIELNEGDIFEEPGYEAIDETDGDISDKVTVSGYLNSAVSGTYTITYSVKDNEGNETSIDRYIVILPKKETENNSDEENMEDIENKEEDIPEKTEEIIDSEIKPEQKPEIPPPEIEENENNDKIIYLTFDDGPSKYTPELLDILDRYGIKATFFVVGSGRTDLIDDIYNAGHQIGAHSYSHDYSQIYTDVESYLEDLSNIQNIIFNNTGTFTNLIRFPGGSSNTVSKKYSEGIMTELAQEVTNLGYTYFDWNVSGEDAGSAKTADEVYNNVINEIGNRKESVVLLHDTKQYTIDAVEKIIEWGLENGYKFMTLNSESPTAHHKIYN